MSDRNMFFLFSFMQRTKTVNNHASNNIRTNLTNWQKLDFVRSLNATYFLYHSCWKWLLKAHTMNLKNSRPWNPSGDNMQATSVRFQSPTPRAPRAKLLGTPAPLRTGPLRLRSQQGQGTQSSLHETPILDVRPTEPSNQSRSFQCSDVETLSQMTLRPTRTHRTLSSLPGTSRPWPKQRRERSLQVRN